MTMLRINDRTKAALRRLARERGEPMGRVVEELVEAAQAEQFFASAEEAYRRLHDDPIAWREERAERATWEATLRDGLADE